MNESSNFDQFIGKMENSLIRERLESYEFLNRSFTEKRVQPFMNDSLQLLACEYKEMILEHYIDYRYELANRLRTIRSKDHPFKKKGKIHSKDYLINKITIET